MRAILLIAVAPLAVPLLGLLARLWRSGSSRSGTWYWRAWWWYGHHFGLYRINWAWKKRRT